MTTPGPTHIVGCPRCGVLLQRDSINSGNTYGATRWSDGWVNAPFFPEQPMVACCRGCSEFFWLEEAPEVGQLAPFDLDHLDKFDIWIDGFEVLEALLPTMQLLISTIGTPATEDDARAALAQLPYRVSERTTERGVEFMRYRLDRLGARLRVELVEKGVDPQGWHALPTAADPPDLLPAIAALEPTTKRERILRLRAWWRGNHPFRRDPPVTLPVPEGAARENLERLLVLEKRRRRAIQSQLDGLHLLTKV